LTNRRTRLLYERRSTTAACWASRSIPFGKQEPAFFGLPGTCLFEGGHPRREHGVIKCSFKCMVCIIDWLTR